VKLHSLAEGGAWTAKLRQRTPQTTYPTQTANLLNVTRAAIDPSNTGVTTQQTVDNPLRYSLVGTNDAIAKLQGLAFTNIGRTYVGSTNGAALNRGIERFTFTACELALQKLETTGGLKRPLVTHTHDRGSNRSGMAAVAVSQQDLSQLHFPAAAQPDYREPLGALHLQSGGGPRALRAAGTQVDRSERLLDAARARGATLAGGVPAGGRRVQGFAHCRKQMSGWGGPPRYGTPSLGRRLFWRLACVT